MCHEINVSPCGCYVWRERPASAGAMANLELYNKIESVYNANHGVSGSPRVCHDLKEQGIARSEDRIARLIRP